MVKNILQECDNYLIQSLNHETYLQRVKKISGFDDKSCYINNFRSKPWKYY